MYNNMKDVQEEGVFNGLHEAIINYDKIKAKKLAEEVVKKNIDLAKTLNILTDAIRWVGIRFQEGDLWLPDLIAAADTLKSAMPIIEEEIERRGIKRDTVCTIVIGTVFGDIHNIGKDMVATLLKSAGYTIYDLGVDVRTDKFIETVKKYNADILAMSSLLTTNISEMKKVIDSLKWKKLNKKVFVIVGGGALTEDFARQIGADGYEPTAIGAVGLVKRLLNSRRG